MFLLGCVFYAVLIVPIIGRLVFVPMAARDIGGAWWINMGAMAIATLAGSRLMMLPTYNVHVAVLRQAISPLTVLCWVAATAWIPLLTVLFSWKHLVWRAPLRYGADGWSAVFPLGMYTCATEVFWQASDLSFLRPVPRGFFWVAVAAWGLTTSGLLGSLNWRR